MPFVDSHNHLQRFDDPARIVAEMQGAGITGCVVNGTRESDWEAVGRLAEEYPDFVQPAFGLHPWFAAERSEQWFARLEGYLDRFPKASVGEIGLDGWIEGPSLEEQREVFLPQLALARERGLPVTVHALKAWEPLFDAFKRETAPKFLLHSFGGSAELVDRLVPIGAWFSFSGYFLHPRKAKVLEAFKSVPEERLLLETDAPEMMPPDEFVSHPIDGMNHPANLLKIAEGLAASLGMELNHLAELTTRNHAILFDERKASS
jgi:TatD DNase family protein